MHGVSSTAEPQICSPGRVFFGGGRKQGSWFVFHVTLVKQNPPWLLSDQAFVPVPALSDVSGNLHSCSVWASSVGQDNGSQDVWGYVLPKHSQFHLSFIKTLIPRPIVPFLALVNIFFTWSSARSFSLGNGVLHQRIYCHKKAQLFPGAFSGISNGCLSLELNFPWDTYSKQMQTNIKTLTLLNAKSNNPYALSSFPLTVFTVLLE